MTFCSCRAALSLAPGGLCTPGLRSESRQVTTLPTAELVQRHVRLKKIKTMLKTERRLCRALTGNDTLLHRQYKSIWTEIFASVHHHSKHITKQITCNLQLQS